MDKIKWGEYFFQFQLIDVSRSSRQISDRDGCPSRPGTIGEASLSASMNVDLTPERLEDTEKENMISPEFPSVLSMLSVVKNLSLKILSEPKGEEKRIV
jgi:hypothetical protein